MRSSTPFGLSPRKQSDDSHDYYHEHHPHQDGDPIGVALLCGRRRLDEATHGGIVECRFTIVDLRFKGSYSPPTVRPSIRIVGQATAPRNSRSFPISEILKKISFKLPATVISSTG